MYFRLRERNLRRIRLGKLWSVAMIIGTCLVLAIPAIAARELSRTERAALEVVDTNQVGIERTIVHFGKKHTLGRNEVVGSCSVVNKYAKITNLSVEAKARVNKAAEFSGVYDQQQAIIRLGTIAKDIQELQDLLSAICLQYWTGGLETSQYLRLNVVVTRALSRKREGLPDLPETVLLIDSPARVYGSSNSSAGQGEIIAGNVSRTDLLPSGVTNADYLYGHLRAAGIQNRILTTAANPMWVRTDDVAADPPTLIVLHLSAFEAEKVYFGCNPNSRERGNHCGYELYNFLAELLKKGSSFLLYTRTPQICSDHTRQIIVERLRNDLNVPNDRLRDIVLFQAQSGETFKMLDNSKLGRRISIVVARLLRDGPVSAASVDDAACTLVP